MEKVHPVVIGNDDFEDRENSLSSSFCEFSDYEVPDARKITMNFQLNTILQIGSFELIR